MVEPKAASFRELGMSDEPLYGPRKLLLLGYGADEQAAVMALLAGTLGLGDVPVLFVTADDRFKTMKDLFALERGAGEGVDVTAPRAFIMAGVTERELQAIMGGYRKAGLPQPLWATLTPISEGWSLRQLVADLAAERAAMAQGRPPLPRKKNDP